MNALGLIKLILAWGALIGSVVCLVVGAPQALPLAVIAAAAGLAPTSA